MLLENNFELEEEMPMGGDDDEEEEDAPGKDDANDGEVVAEDDLPGWGNTIGDDKSDDL